MRGLRGVQIGDGEPGRHVAALGHVEELAAELLCVGVGLKAEGRAAGWVVAADAVLLQDLGDAVGIGDVGRGLLRAGCVTGQERECDTNDRAVAGSQEVET